MTLMPSNLMENPHRRYNPLTREWILVSPHRMERPWRGLQEPVHDAAVPAHDPDCYLCPGNTRVGDRKNPGYQGTFVFDNDYPALTARTPDERDTRNDLLLARSERGLCRVVCFSPRHDLSLSMMKRSEIELVVDVWTKQYTDLLALPGIEYVQIFENRGALMGCSNPHPHCQVWATEHLPNEPAKEQAAFLEHLYDHDACMLCRYLEIEQKEDERLVFQNEDFVVVVPFWALWPFETLVMSRRHRTGLDELSDRERVNLADALGRLTARYDNLFRTPFPYSMGFHQRPAEMGSGQEWHLHAHYYPPLLRSASVRKFMVGFEMLATPQRDITAEAAATHLRALPDTHYDAVR